MNNKTHGYDEFQGMGWVAGSAGVLFIIGAGLDLFAEHADAQVNVSAMLLALFLAFWSSVLGTVGLLFLSVWWLVRWRRVRVKRAAMNRYAPAEPRSRRLEHEELQGSQFLQEEVASVVPSRSSRESDDANEPSSFTRVT